MRDCITGLDCLAEAHFSDCPAMPSTDLHRQLRDAQMGLAEAEADRNRWLAEAARLHEALVEIANADPVDLALDPQWAARLARAVVDFSRWTVS